MAEARLARQKGLAREPAEAHAHKHDRKDRHHQREAPQELGASDQDQRRFDLEDDGHRQDDERRHHVGGPHRARVEADDHGTRDHRGDLADRRERERDQDAERKVAKPRKGDQAVDQQAAVAERKRNCEHGRDLACVDLRLAQRRREQDLEGRSLALADE